MNETTLEHVYLTLKSIKDNKISELTEIKSWWENKILGKNSTREDVWDMIHIKRFVKQAITEDNGRGDLFYDIAPDGNFTAKIISKVMVF